MKRFYCTICRRIKRVRRLPANTTRVNSDNMMERVGTCDKHDAGYTSVSVKLANLKNTLRKAN